MSKRLLGAIVRGWLATLFLAAPSFAIDKFEIGSDRDTTYLPYTLNEIRSGNRGVISKVDFHPVDVFQTAVGDSGEGSYFCGYNPDLNVDNPAIFSFIRYPIYRIMDDFPVRMTVTDWRIYPDRKTGLKTIIGVGYKNDSAFAFKLAPETDTFEKIFLTTGKDATGDGKWDPAVRVNYVGDFDYDDSTEAFVYVDAARELHPRELLCLDLENFRVRWSLPIASMVCTVAFYPCGDSLNPGVIFTTYNIKNGVTDSNFSDQFGYLVRLDRQGQIVFRKVNCVQHGMNTLIPGRRPNRFYLLHEKNLIDPDNVDTSRSTTFHISEIDDSGRVIKGLETPLLPCYHWWMEYGPRRDTALFVTFENGMTRVYTPDLDLLAECDKGRTGLYCGRIKLAGLNDQAVVFSDGIYSSDLKKLAAFPPAVEYYRILAADQQGRVTALALGAGNYYGIFVVDEKTWWEMLAIAYVRHRAIVLMIFSGLIVGLVVVNYYRKRTKYHLDFIQAQKKEIELTHRRLAATVDALPDILIELDGRGRIYLFRAPNTPSLTLPPHDLIGRNIREAFSPKAADAILTAVAEAGRFGRRTGDIFSLQLPDGVRWFELSVSAPGDFRSPDAHFIVLARDITRRKHVEDALRESEDRFRSIFDNALVGMYRTTPDGKILMVNPTLVRMLGYDSADELIKRNLEQAGFEPEYPRAQFKERIERDGLITGMESAWRRRDGTQLIVRENARGVRDADGQILYYEGAVEDITGWKEAEEALRLSEERYRTLQANVPIGVFRVAPGGNLISVNPALVRMFAYDSEEELKSQPIGPRYADPKVRAEVLHQLATVGSFSSEVEVLRKDGSPFWVLLSAKAMPDELGQISFIDGVMQDITVQKAAEDALRQSEERYRTLQANVPIGVFRSTPAGKVISINPAVVKMFGYDTEEEVRGLTSMIAYADPREREEFVNRLNLEGSVASFEVHARRRDGSLMWVMLSAQAMRGRDGKIAYIDGVARDITERKAAETALRESEEKYRTLVNNISDGVFRTDAHGHFTFVNKAMQERSGVPMERLIGHHFNELVNIGDRQLLQDSFNEIMTGREILPREFSYTTAGGRTLTIEMGGRPIFENGRVIGVQGLTRDITERKRVQLALQDSLNQSRAILNAIPDIMFQISRDGIFLDYGANTGNLYVSPSEFLGRNFRDILPPELAATTAAYIEKTMQTGLLQIYEYELLMSTGIHNFEARMIPCGDDAVLAIIRDVSARKKAEAELQQAHQALKRANDDLEFRVQERTEELSNANIRLNQEIAERRWAELALRESEQILRIFLDSLSGPAIMLDRQGIILLANQALADRVGVNTEGLLGRYSYDFLPREIADKRRALIEEAFSTGQSLSFEDSRNGHHFINYVYPIRDSENNVTRAAIYALDITERRWAEEALEQSEERYRSLVETANSLVVCLDGHANITLFNKECERVTGYKREEVLGKCWHQLFLPPTHRHEGFNDFARWVQLHPSDTYEGPLLTKTGDVKTILWSNSAIFISDPERMTAFAVGQDITDRKRFELELRHSEEKYRLLVEHVPSSIALVDQDGTFLFVNDVAARYVNRSIDSIVGKTQWEIFPREVADRQMGSVRRVIAANEGIVGEFRTFLDDQWRWFYTSLQPFRDASGEVNAVLIIAHDITDLKLATERLIAAEQEKYRQARDIAGGVAHEIHNALCPAVNAIEKLKSRLALTAAHEQTRNADLLALGDAAVARAMNLTDLVRSYSRLEVEQAAVTIELKDIIDEIVYLNSMRAQELAVSVQVNIPTGCRIHCNRNHLWSFFNNLMTNALDALVEVPSRAIAISAVNNQNHVTVTFADSGPGIPVEIRERIFDLFFSTRPGTGSGVGLAMVRKIADLYHVEIQIETANDKGTTFIITWPLQPYTDEDKTAGRPE
jgi:PAS domain S-box-containing protein